MTKTCCPPDCPRQGDTPMAQKIRGSPIYICADCGAVFDAPRIKTYRQNLDGEHGIETVTERRCPWCGSEEIEQEEL